MEGLGGKTDWTLNVEGLRAGTVDQLAANLLERGDLARGKGDTDLVDFLYIQIIITLANVSRRCTAIHGQLASKRLSCSCSFIMPGAAKLSALSPSIL